MGCLIELLVDLIIGIYVELMSLVLPNRIISEKTRFILEVILDVFAIMLLIAIGLGAILLLNNEPIVRNAGHYMIYIPLTIIVIQIILGIIVRIVAKTR